MTARLQSQTAEPAGFLGTVGATYEAGQRVAPLDARNRSMAAISASRSCRAHLHACHVLRNADAMFG